MKPFDDEEVPFPTGTTNREAHQKGNALKGWRGVGKIQKGFSVRSEVAYHAEARLTPSPEDPRYDRDIVRVFGRIHDKVERAHHDASPTE